MPSIEDRIEAMWEDPQTRRERWLGFYGKFCYEVGVVLLGFIVFFGPIYLAAWLLAELSLVAGVLSLAAPLPLFYVAASEAFCSIIGR